MGAEESALQQGLPPPPPAKALVAGLRLGQRLRRTPSTEAAEVQSTRPVAWMQTDKLLKNLSWSQTGTVASVASSAALAKPILGAEHLESSPAHSGRHRGSSTRAIQLHNL